MIEGENKLTECKKSLLKQGTKVEFNWHGSKTKCTGRIEVDEWGNVYFCHEHNYKDDVLTEVGETMQYYNRLDSYFFFNHFEILN
jgi:hypothetical protein